MKSIYVLTLTILILSGCKKDDKIPAGLSGTWELESSFSGWGGTQTYPPGNGNTITFSDNNYSEKIKSADTTYQISGTFKVFSGKPCDGASEQTLIQFDMLEHIESFSLADGKLSIGTTECILDGGGSTYRKIQ